jgi:hypothetical protein
MKQNKKLCVRGREKSTYWPCGFTLVAEFFESVIYSTETQNCRPTLLAGGCVGLWQEREKLAARSRGPDARHHPQKQSHRNDIMLGAR